MHCAQVVTLSFVMLCDDEAPVMHGAHLMYCTMYVSFTSSEHRTQKRFGAWGGSQAGFLYSDRQIANIKKQIQTSKVEAEGLCGHICFTRDGARSAIDRADKGSWPAGVDADGRLPCMHSRGHGAYERRE